MSWRNLISAVAVVGVCGGAVAVGTVAQSSTATQVAADSGAVRDFLRAARLSCPVVASADEESLVSAVAVPDTPGQDVPGSATIADARGKPMTRVTVPGATAQTDHDGSQISAVGGLAPGLVSAQVVDDPRGEGKGLASTPCVAPGAESWFVGGGAAQGQRSVLTLTNPTASDSLVDVAAYGKGGQLELAGDDGISVPAGDTVRVGIDTLAHGTDQVALRVRTRVGLISAAVVDDRMEGLTPMGTDVIGDAGSPEKTVVLAGMPAGAGGRELQILAPTDSGKVRVRALTENGPLPLLAGEPIDLRAGHLTVIDLTKELGGRAAAIEITGDTRVVAAASATTAVDESIKARRSAAVAAAERALKQAKGDAARSEAQATLERAETANAIDPGEDIAWFGPAPVVPGTSAVTGLRKSLDASLLLSSADGTVTVKVSVLPAGQSGAEVRPARTVEVPGGSTVAVPLSGPTDTYTAIVTRTSGSGELHAGHVQLADGRSMTGYALAPLQVWTPVDRAQPVYGN
ncbi:MAG: DUF5719 family protein [Candidatus Nanopelagicales bacterium]